MNIRVVSSREEIFTINPNERIVHLAFRPSNNDIFGLVETCPKIEVIQLPQSYKRTISKSIEMFLKKQRIQLTEGDVWGHGTFSSYLYEIRFIILFYVIGDWASTACALPFGVEYNSVPAMLLTNYGIYCLLLVKVGFILMLFYTAPVIKGSRYRWAFTKHIIESVGILATINNLMVIWYGNSLIQIIGLI
jgi:hypothetical protein